MNDTGLKLIGLLAQSYMNTVGNWSTDIHLFHMIYLIFG